MCYMFSVIDFVPQLRVRETHQFRQAVAKKINNLTLVYTEDAVKPRDAQRARGFMHLTQVEKCHLCTAPRALGFTHRDNKHFDGTTAGSAIVNIPSEPDDALWKMSVADKRTYYGTNGFTEAADDDADKSKYPARADTDVEPVNHWTTPKVLWDELIWRVQAKAVIDLTASETLAIVCLEEQIMYLGITFTEAGADLLNKRLAARVFRCFSDEKSPLYKPELAKALSAHRQITATEQHNTKPAAKRAAGVGRRRAAMAAVAAASEQAATGTAPEPQEGQQDDGALSQGEF